MPEVKEKGDKFITTDEYEIKYFLDKSEYDKLCKMFATNKSISFEQVNYYYDTHDKQLRDKNITARIRKKGDHIEATIKEHIPQRTHSKETAFGVEKVSDKIYYKGKTLYLQGELHTKRTEIKICDGLVLMLDHNKYLGMHDYELELEYDPSVKEQAIDTIDTLRSILQKDSAFPLSKPKSDRFFERLDSQADLSNNALNKNEFHT